MPSPIKQVHVTVPTNLPTEILSEDYAECLFVIRSAQSSVTCVKFSPCGKFFAFASGDATVEIYTLQGQPMYRLFGLHKLGVNTIAWSQCSAYIAMGSDDGFVSLWSISEQLPLLLLKAHAHSVLSVAFSPNSNLLISASADNTICMFDVLTGSLLRQLDAHNDIVTDVLFSIDGSYIISSSNDGTIRLWDVTTGFCLRTITSESTRAAFGKVMVSPRNPNILVTTCLDNCIRVYDIPTSTCIAILVGQINTRYPIQLSFLNEPNFNEITNTFYEQMALSQKHPFIDSMIYTVRDGVTDTPGIHSKTPSVTQIDELIKISLNRPQVTHIVSGSEDGALCVWLAKSHLEQLESLQQVNLLEKSGGESISTGSNAYKCAPTPPSSVVKQGELYFKIKSHYDVIRAIDCHPYLPLVLAGGMEKDSTLKLWKLNKK